MNTRHVTDKAERKALKRKARKEAPAYKGRTQGQDRGSLKRKIRKASKGVSKRK